ncbi:hypothetical protein LCGC14_1591250 [marine sediment metagenome]|uniref:Uncharacterized protein n=1 Tax=marine sediment metagenome TaxID=412755 RepID=A0A0F9KUK6_9ZZZZ
MPFFRKRPIVIEAEQFFPDIKPWPKGVREINHGDKSLDYFYIDTLEGGHKVSVGDWIITGVRGEKYPCKPGIFQETYESVEEA